MLLHVSVETGEGLSAGCPLSRRTLDGEFEVTSLALCLSPNPPMDGARTAEVGKGVTGAMIWARIRVDGRLAGGLQALLGAPMAACSGCGERDGGIGHGKRRSRTGMARVGGDVQLTGWRVRGGRAPSGWEWNGSQPGQGAAELGFPRPMLGKMQGEAARRAGEPSR